ncbi:MAG: 4-alpha-glucanotransferase [Pseudomonadota bacterium]
MPEIKDIEEHVLDRRRAGILLHITSLPGELENGDLGREAFHFVDFLSTSGISVWQLLPVGQTHDDGSPYQCLSIHAGNPNLISLDWLEERGWLVKPKMPRVPGAAAEYRSVCLRKAFLAFSEKADDASRIDYQTFVAANAYWLDDYALYAVLKEKFFSTSWHEWPKQYRDRNTDALAEIRRNMESTIGRIKFEQYVFYRQWHELRDYAHQHGILLFGDMPIFVAYDSADVWVNRDHFALDETGATRVVAGVPPDYFSETGQRWGNPHYNWALMEENGFRWWIERLRTQLDLFDLVRIDHFRGLEAYWEIPASEMTAMNGRWVKAPGDALLRKIRDVFGSIPLVAEDLGVITPEVESLRDKFELPGMKILQFAFDGGSKNPYLPLNHTPNSVVYTGTHDNDTTVSWFDSLPGPVKGYVKEYLGFPGEKMPWPMVRCALASVSLLAVIPMQDVLGLGREGRMNTPGTVVGNWKWRFSWDQVTEQTLSRLARLVKLYGRSGHS